MSRKLSQWLADMKSNDTKSGLIDEALRIVEEAKSNRIVLRLLGAIAFRIHCQEFSHLYDTFKREITDIDLVGYKRQKTDISDLIQNLGYHVRKHELLLYASQNRFFFHSKDNAWHVDVFLDELNMCHKIDFKGRLEIDFPAVSLADLLLEKMQIVQINEKDVKDTIILLREHQVGNQEKETINAEYISDLLSKDWGFYYTVTSNLKKIKNFLPQYSSLETADRIDVERKIDELLKRVEEKEKSLGWKMRAKIGKRKKWYKEVEYTQAMYDHY